MRILLRVSAFVWRPGQHPRSRACDALHVRQSWLAMDISLQGRRIVRRDTYTYAMPGCVSEQHLRAREALHVQEDCWLPEANPIPGADRASGKLPEGGV